jgi:CRISPR-associated protein Cas1
MNSDYIQMPQKIIQPDLFLSQDSIYAYIDPPLFQETLIRWQFSENIFYLVSKDLSYLLVSGYGVKLSKKSERLVIKEGTKSVYELPFFRLKNVAIMSKGVGFSSDLIENFTKNEIVLSFHDFSAKPYALIQSVKDLTHTNIKRKQILAQDNVISIDISKQIVAGKISNQIALLKYASKNLKADNPVHMPKITAVKNACSKIQKLLDEVINVSLEINASDARYIFMGYEGTSARLYWSAFASLISDKVDFLGRQSNIPKDVVNTLLNYGYGILYSKIWSSLIIAGLDPYLGFLHSEQSGKPSLVFDMIEEFRAPIIDRTVLSYIMLNRPIKIEHGLLNLETRHAFSEKILERLTSAEYYEGRKIMFSDIILSQAQKLVAFLENRTSKYVAFSFKW